MLYVYNLMTGDTHLFELAGEYLYMLYVYNLMTGDTHLFELVGEYLYII